MASPDVIYTAARRIVDAGLAKDDSAFTPGVPVWTAAVADDLHRRFVMAPDLGNRSFLDKLRDQLAEAPPTTVQLAAELLYLYLLAPVDMGWDAKRALLSGTLGIATQPVSIPAELDAALDGGFARVGTAYLTQRDRQLSFLVRLLQAWKALLPERRARALADPWAFRVVVDEVPIQSAYSQRNALLHLVFPETFQSIVSRQHKSDILAAFAGEIADRSGDEDRDLFSLRRKLEQSHGGPVSFYETPDIAARWRASGPAVEEPGDGLRGWLVRGSNVDGQDLVPDWLTRGYCSLSWPEAPGIRAGQSRRDLDAALAAARPDLTARQRAIHVGVLDRFLNQMQAGHLVATVDGPYLYVGTVTGEPTPDPSNRLATHQRSVDWVKLDPRLRRDQLSDATRDKLSGQMTVSDLRPSVSEFARLAGLDEETVVATADVDAQVKQPVRLPEPTQALADKLLVGMDWLAETIDLLREKKQLVLYGPPGTGKTYLAQEIALYLSEQTSGAYRLVQFHPSYAYEDFFEGFRPQQGVATGTIGFALEPGPFRQLVAEAAEDVSRAYVLVIDEINRANLAKVFGELYFLLEYRDRAVTLQYSPNEEFRLPANVFLIGTMNTADRSIALVDAAMRRRFAWQGLFPGEPPVDGMLRAWLRLKGLPLDRAHLLDELNERIGDRDSAIGPAYLMTRSIASEDGLARVWKHHILPLLEERHVGEGIDVRARYGLEALRALRTTAIIEPTAEPREEERGQLLR